MHVRGSRFWWVIFWLGASAFAVEQGPSKEYQVKAAFLYNFAHFVNWPSTVFTNASQPFQIGVLGENPFGKSLEAITAGESIQNRKPAIVTSTNPSALADCQVVFIAKSEMNRAPQIRAEFRSRPILTVGEADGGGPDMAIISFYRDGPKIRFQINREAARTAGLKLSSELLNLGKASHP